MSDLVSKKPSLWIMVLATWFGAGKIPIASGTWGSLAALPFAWAILQYSSVYALIAASVLIFFIGWWVSEKVVIGINKQDPSLIVIDEVAGQWLTLIPPVLIFGTESLSMIVYLVAFLAFRATDILKPFPAGWADKNIKGGLGVMVDDCLAAVYSSAIVCLYIIYI